MEQGDQGLYPIHPLPRVRSSSNETMLTDVMSSVSLLPFWVMLVAAFGGRGWTWHAVVSAFILGWLCSRVHARLGGIHRD